MSLFRRETRSWTPEPIIPPFPGTDVFGNSTPSMTSAMRLSAVWGCVRLLADTVSMMPLHNYRLTPSDTPGAEPMIRKRIGDPAWLTSPDGSNTLPDWIYMAMVSLLLRGCAPGEIIARGSDGFPTAVKWHNYDEISFDRDRVTGGIVMRTREGRSIPASDQFLIHAYRMPGMQLGLSPISYGAMTMNTDAEVQKFALGFFKDALHPASVVTSDQPIQQEDARSIKDRVMKSRGSREPLVLGANLKLTPMAVSPNESQFLETQKWSVATICRIFGVPPEMVASESGNSMDYSNVEQRAIDYLTYSVQPWLSRLEAALARLLPGSQHLRFDTSVLLRTDMQTLLTAGAIGIAAKVHTPDEIRALRDYAPLTEEQKKLLDLVPLTVQPTGKPAIQSPSHPPIVDFDDPGAEGDGLQGGINGPNA